MQEIRCPECGYRLRTRECPICLTRVPFPVAAGKSDASKKDRPSRPVKTYFPNVNMPRRQKSQKQVKPRIVTTVIAVLVAFLPLLTELFEGIQTAAPEPDYPASYYEAFLEAGSGDAAGLATIDAQTLFDNHEVRIVADSMGLMYNDPAIRLTINNASDRDVTVSSDLLSVNGYILSSSGLFSEILAGEEVQTYLRLYDYDLEEAGITTVGDVEFLLDVYDSNDYSDVVIDAPIRLQTSDFGVEQPVDDRGLLVYDAGGVRIVFRNAEVDEYGDCTLTFFAENLSSKTVNIGDTGICINGQEVDCLLWCNLRPDTRAVHHVYIFDIDELKIKKTSQLEEITLNLYLQDAETWDAAEAVCETVTIDLIQNEVSAEPA